MDCEGEKKITARGGILRSRSEADRERKANSTMREKRPPSAAISEMIKGATLESEEPRAPVPEGNNRPRDVEYREWEEGKASIFLNNA